MAEPPPFDIPRVLVARDPRNPQHCRAALRLLLECGTVISSVKTAQELAVFSLKLSQRVLVSEPGTMQYDYVVGAHYFLDEGLMFADNVIVTCTVCRQALQLRPHAPTKSVMCCFCAADRVLKEYWQKAH